MSRLVRLRWPALGVLVLVVSALVPAAQRAAVPDNALSVWFLETDPQLQAYHEFHRQFGNDEVVMVMVEPPGGALSTTGLAVLERLSAGLEALPGVERVHSLLTVQDAWHTRDEDGTEFLHFDRALQGGLERLRENPLLVDRLISADGARAMFWVEMAVMSDFDFRRDSIVASVRDTTDEILGEAPHALGGIGVIYSGLNLLTQRDFGMFLGLGYLVIFALMGWLLRSWRLVVASMGVVTAGILVALGVYGLAGHQMNLVTVVLPTLIIVLGLADVVHFPAAFSQAQREHPERSRPQQVAASMKRVLVPCTVTTLTTMAGFGALASAPMAVIRHLGLYAALGVGAALLASLVTMAVALCALPAGWRLPESPLIHGALGVVRRALDQRRGLLMGLSLALVTLAAVGASRVVTDTYTLGYLPDDHRVVLDHDLIEARWGDYTVLDFLVRPAPGLSVDSPEILEATQRFQERAVTLDEVRLGYGLHSVHRRLADVLQAEVPDEEALPADLVSQLNLLLEIQGFPWERDHPDFGDNVLAPWMTEDGSLGRMTLVGSMLSAAAGDAVLDRLAVLAEQSIGPHGSIEAAGYPPLYTRIVDYAMTSQVRSFFLALGIIFSLMLLWLRSLRLALISLVPNVFPVLVMMGVMGALGIHLDIATATVAAIVIGVSIDDTVHFLLNWRRAEREGRSWEESVDSTLRHAGVPAVLTTLLLVVGYPMLMLAEVRTVVAFGLLTTVAAAAALFGDLVILPLLLRLLPRRRAA